MSKRVYLAWAAVVVFVLAGCTAPPPDPPLPYTYSEETIVVVIQSSNDTVWGFTGLVDGIEAVDRLRVMGHIKAMPENVETLKDGLQIGESLTVPVMVSPGY